jgi:gliding motility-associated-like protein
VAGGSPAYAYLWSNGDTTSTALSLDAEAYFVTITDAKGCSNVDSVLITEPAPLELSLLVSPPACFSGNDGAVNAQVSGGIAPYSYNWSNGGNTPELTGLTAGNYCLTVTEANGCSVVQCTDVTGASALVLSAEPFNATCNGRADGKIGLTVSGGNPAYSFTWSNGETTEDIGDLQAGVYTVIVTDANGCTDSIQTSIGEPPPLELNFRNTPVECFGASDGSSVATAGGGALPYTYQWSDGTTGSEIIDIPAGIYTLTLTDGNGCTVEKSTEILQPANALTATASVEDVSCHGLQDGRIQLAGQGGTPPYLYSLDGDNYKTNPQWIALASGYYDAYIKDAYHCMVELSQLFIDEPLPLLVDLGPDTLVVFSTHLQIFPTILQVDSLEIETYQWTSSNPQTPVLYPDRRVGEFVVISPTTARLVVTDTNGCEGEDLINIFVRELRSIQVPTGFSPGAGGNLQNDLLHVHGSSFMVDKIRLFRVFDRWGELIFEAKDFPVNDLNAGWDGTFKGREMPSGVYVWYLEVDFVDGSTESYKGHTTLIK